MFDVFAFIEHGEIGLMGRDPQIMPGQANHQLPNLHKEFVLRLVAKAILKYLLRLISREAMTMTFVSLVLIHFLTPIISVQIMILSLRGHLQIDG
jgi:hypothetical protein